MKLFLGEPAKILGAVQALLAMVVAFEWFDLTQEQSGLLLTVAGAFLGLVSAFATRDTVTGAVVAFINAGAAALATWGWSWTENQVATFAAVIAMVAGWAQANYTEPLAVGTFANGAAAGARY